MRYCAIVPPRLRGRTPAEIHRGGTGSTGRERAGRARHRGRAAAAAGCLEARHLHDPGAAADGGGGAVAARRGNDPVLGEVRIRHGNHARGEGGTGCVGGPGGDSGTDDEFARGGRGRRPAAGAGCRPGGRGHHIERARRIQALVFQDADVRVDRGAVEGDRHGIERRRGDVLRVVDRLAERAADHRGTYREGVGVAARIGHAPEGGGRIVPANDDDVQVPAELHGVVAHRHARLRRLWRGVVALHEGDLRRGDGVGGAGLRAGQAPRLHGDGVDRGRSADQERLRVGRRGERRHGAVEGVVDRRAGGGGERHQLRAGVAPRYRRERRRRQARRGRTQQPVYVHFVLRADEDLAVGDGGHHELHRWPATITAAGGLVAVVELAGEVGRIVGVQYPGVVDAVALHGPQHRAGGAGTGRRDHRLRARIAEGGRRLRGRRGGEEAIGEGVDLARVFRAAEIGAALPVGGRREAVAHVRKRRCARGDRSVADRVRNPLHDVGIRARVGAVELPHVVPVDEVELAILARAHHEVRMRGSAGRIRQQRKASGGDVEVGRADRGLVEGRKVVGDHRGGAAGGELEERVAPGAHAVEITVAGGEVDVARRIDRRGLAARPDPRPLLSAGGSREHAHLREVGRVVAEQPADPGEAIPARAEADVYDAVGEEQPRALQARRGVHLQRDHARADRCLDYRRGELVRAAGDIERVQGVERRGSALHGLGHDVQRAARGVDHRRGGDRDLRHHVLAYRVRGARGQSGGRIDEAAPPQGRRAVGVDRVDTAVLGGGEYDVERAQARQGQVRLHQRLRVGVAVEGEGVDLAERRRADIGDGERRFVEVLAGARRIAVGDQHVGLGLGGAGES